ncbi:murein hydrolase activator EnvC family protein [Parasporobacterium paucivorans]|uniref:Peptidase family M23 n=1 Tax=Parasporobacterium paucivorans DSM 15970 TaxID=1122934 RepID=A0A1M6KVD5_9FIRM|nr:M23 family metallopeptidase [Parasporobacterium paucivorans]SHJ62843.1 Peptidase family M23 [Parasporobacterium paucivorans DSM 15970]
MKKRLINIWSIVITVLLVISLAVVPAFATSVQKEEAKKEELQNELSEAQKTLNNLKDLKSDTAAYVEALDGELSKVYESVGALEDQSAQKATQIAALEETIAQKQSEIEAGYAAMKKRIQFMYENTQSSYVEMVLGSKDVSELLNKAEYLSELTGYDRNMLDQMNAAMQEIENSKAAIEEEQAAIEALKAEQEAKQAEIEALTTEKQAQLNEYDSMIEDTEAQTKQLAKEIAQQEAAIASIKAKVDATNKTSGASGGKTYTGQFLWPVNNGYKISDSYGWRTLNGGSQFHNGIDMPAPIGTPIMAAEAGSVVISQYSTTAGEWIVIYHGNNTYTEYMHCDTRNVSAGQTVTKGQVIGTVGNTGNSFGSHLHFGVNVQSGSGFSVYDRVDPSPYLGI